MLVSGIPVWERDPSRLDDAIQLWQDVIVADSP
jgi:hypothetical protein